MKKILLMAGVIVLITVLFHFLIFKKERVVTIVYTTDLQGYITPHEDYTVKERPLIGGSAYLAAHIKKERNIAQRRNRDFLFVDTGNFFSGQAEGYFSGGLSVIEIMNKLGYDAMAIGPKDFAFGEENLRRLSKEAKFPFLGANVVEENSDEIVDYLRPYVINDCKGIKIGIIGIVSPAIFLENAKGIRVLDPVSTANKYVSLLKNAGVNAVVILSSLGLEEDKRLAHEVKGINIIIGGNDRKGGRGVWPYYIDPRNKTVIVDSWDRVISCYKIDCVLDRQGTPLKYKPKWQDLLPASIKPDPEVQLIVQKYTEAVKEKKRESIGYVQMPFARAKAQESTLGNWAADILRGKTKANIALVGGLQADLKQGRITIGDVYNILPIIDRLDIVGFNLAILELSGEQIKDILELGVSYGIESGTGVLQVSGLKYSYDLKRKKWDRIVEVNVNGEKLDLSKTYKVAANGYLASGLGGYSLVTDAIKRYDTGLMDFDVLVGYIKKHSSVTVPLLEGRIKSQDGE